MGDSSARAVQIGAQQDRLTTASQLVNVDLNMTESQRPNSRGIMAPECHILCLNTITSTVLLQVEIKPFGSNELLFNRIKDEYETVRGRHEWSISLVLPSRFDELLNKIPAQSPWCPFLLGRLDLLSKLRKSLGEGN
jgi:hypothetical protein